MGEMSAHFQLNVKGHAPQVLQCLLASSMLNIWNGGMGFKHFKANTVQKKELNLIYKISREACYSGPLANTIGQGYTVVKCSCLDS